MHPNEQLITDFYLAFKNHDPQGMTTCYAKNIIFEDPAFGKIQGKRAFAMWYMLIERGGDALHIEFSEVQANDYNGSAKWTATYTYGPQKRKVVNHVVGTFSFQNGKIVQHTDHFDLWRWSQQALGFKGYLLGWTRFMKLKIQQNTSKALSSYLHKMKSFDVAF